MTIILVSYDGLQRHNTALQAKYQEHFGKSAHIDPTTTLTPRQEKAYVTYLVYSLIKAALSDVIPAVTLMQRGITVLYPNDNAFGVLVCQILKRHKIEHALICD